MRRVSPLLVIVVAVVAILAFLRNSDQREPAEEWKPVRPS